MIFKNHVLLKFKMAKLADSNLKHEFFSSDKEAGEKLLQRVNDAVNLLNEYNNRLAVEVDLRKKVTAMIRDYLVAQKELLEQAEQNLEVINFSVCCYLFNSHEFLLTGTSRKTGESAHSKAGGESTCPEFTRSHQTA